MGGAGVVTDSRRRMSVFCSHCFVPAKLSLPAPVSTNSRLWLPCAQQEQPFGYSEYTQVRPAGIRPYHQDISTGQSHPIDTACCVA